MVTVFTMRQILVSRLDVRVQQQLEQEVGEFRNLAGGIDPESGEPFGPRLRPLFDTFLDRNIPADEEELLAFIGGNLYRTKTFADSELGLSERPELVAQWSRIEAPQGGTLSLPMGEVRYLAVPVRANQQVRGTFVVAATLEGERREIEEAVQTAALVGIAALLIGSLLAFLAAGRVLEPLRGLTATARSIEEQDLTARIEVSGSDELAELGHTFNGMLDRLEQAFNSQRSLIRDVSHELRTPITIVRGHLELLGDDPAEQRETVDLVTDELDRMSRLVDDLLTLARAERPDFLKPRPVDLEQLLSETLAKAGALGDREWRLDLVRAPRSAWLDPQRMTQALINLIDNAIHQTDPGTPITLGAEQVEPSRELRLWVADGGGGISPEVKDRLFDRFERGKGGRGYPGTGLGLAIVKAIAEAHGGQVQADSPAQGGAEFSIILPTAQPPPPEGSQDG